MIGSLKLFSFWQFFLFSFIHRICLEYSPSDESDGYDIGEFDKLGSESGSAGTFITGFGGLLHGVGFPLVIRNLDKLAGLCFRYYANMLFSLEGKIMVSRSQTLL